MTFPHLPKATPFPKSNVHAYEQYENNFDYSKWRPDTKLRLLRVKWHLDRHDLPCFQNDAERDEWIAAHTGETYTLDAMCYLTPDNTIKLPIPVQTLQKFNYLVVTMPSAPTVELPYAERDATRTFCYFLADIHPVAPSTTMCALDLDEWTTWRSTITMSGILERGHAPLARITPSQYLSNPMENNAGLLTPDVNYASDSSVVTNSVAVSIQNGRRRICLVCAFSPAQLEKMAENPSTESADTAPAYQDGNTVESWNWGGTGYEPHGDALATACGGDGITMSPTAYRVNADNGSYFDDIAVTNPNIMQGVLAAFIATDDMISAIGDSLDIGGAEWTPITGADATLADIKLTPEMFDLPAQVANVTKLYTSPYSALSITDAWGRETRVNVQDCGKLKIKSLVAIAYPVLRQLAYLDGVGGNGNDAISITSLTGETLPRELPRADVLRTLISYDIPTYALMRDTAVKWDAENHARANEQARRSAVIGYENTGDSADTSVANTERSNTTAVANTERSNTTAVANTKRAGANANDITAYTVTTNQDTLEYTNTNQNDKYTDVAALQLALQNYMATDGAGYIDQTTEVACSLNNKLFQASKDASTSQVITNTLGTIASVALAGGVSLATAGMGTAPSAVALAQMGIVGAATSSAVNTTVNGANVAIGLSKSQEELDAKNEYARGMAAYQKELNEITLKNNLDQQHAALLRDQNLNTHVTNNANRVSTYSTSHNVDTGNANASASATTSNANASASATTSNANASASATTSNANADANRDTTIANAKRSMENARNAYNATIQDLRRTPPTKLGEWTGDNMPDVKGRVMQVKVVTQPVSALIQAGREMQRYGVMAGTYEEMQNLVPTKYFAYWQMRDMWINSTKTPENAINDLRDLFARGVTLWRDPDKIGMVDLYDNLN